MSDATIVIQTPAKLNLFLEVLAKRQDGFHEIETLMAAINLYDRVYATEFPEGRIHLKCRWASGMEAQAASRDGLVAASKPGSLPKDSDNLVWKAVQRLQRLTGTTAGIAIDLVKRIPAAAGLGGASSDAAAALVAANRVWRLGWSREELAEVAAELGSDVAFFLTRRTSGAGMAICRGRGEQIEALSGMPPLHFVIVRPPVGLSTPRVYRECEVPDRPATVDDLVMRLRAGGSVGQDLFNRLQPAAAKLTPWIARLRSVFDQARCQAHQMSGSGSSYFGVCRSARQARRLASFIRATRIGQTFHAATVPHSLRVEAAAQ